MNHAPDGEVRWWIPGPGPDESLRSIVERADQQYGGEREGLRQELMPSATPWHVTASGIDALTARELQHLARTIGVAPRTLFAHRLSDHPMLLLATERRAFCPACWHDDRRAGRPTTFRRAWAGVFCVSCPSHELPLQWAQPGQRKVAEQSMFAAHMPTSRRGRRVLALIEIFARSMEEGLRGRAGWPSGWRGNAVSARALLMRSVVNLGCLLEHPPFVNVAPLPDLAHWIAAPRRRIDPLQSSPWDAVRVLGPPAWRRAAFWMTACYVIPNLPWDERPDGLPSDAFSAFDAQWDSQPATLRELRRTRRYRAALHRMCEAFPIRRRK